MSSESPRIELSVRGLHLQDDTAHLIRRCAEQMLAQIGMSDRRIRVLLEREKTPPQMRAYVAIDDGPRTVRARGKNVDEVLAVRDALSHLAARLVAGRTAK